VVAVFGGLLLNLIIAFLIHRSVYCAGDPVGRALNWKPVAFIGSTHSRWRFSIGISTSKPLARSAAAKHRSRRAPVRSRDHFGVCDGDMRKSCDGESCDGDAHVNMRLPRMSDVSHLRSGALDAYTSGNGSTADLERAEDHLRVCRQCQSKLARWLEKRATGQRCSGWLRSLHTTEDGPMFTSLRKAANGNWMARHWGRQLDGALVFDSVLEAEAYLKNSLTQMFPEHRCSERCRELK
jgi:hypothetical protein